jgi:DNA-binding transcriptional MerR regulator
MNFYQIADLERLTGIKAHTIRIWEKRYNLIEPHRTATNIRYYDDDQAIKLLNVSTLLSEGFKISKIAELSEKEINSHIQGLQKGDGEDSVCSVFIHELIASMLVFDEVGFEKSFSAAVSRFGMYHAMINVFYPFLHKTGLMWRSSDAMPVQEHFASNIIRRKLISAIDNLPVFTKKSKKFLLFLPAEEWHETALLLSDYLIRSKGYKTIYLGQNVPIENLNEVIMSTKPSHLLGFFIARQSPEFIKKALADLSKKYVKQTILIGGSFDFSTALGRRKNIQLLSTPEDLLKFL